MKLLLKACFNTFFYCYRIFVSPLLHQLTWPLCGCRFQPSCSEFAHQEILRLGIAKGLRRAIKRIWMCH